MSKTDKTKPWWLRATERPMVTCVPVHRHHAGACDLPAAPADAFGGVGDWWPTAMAAPEGQTCYWTWTTAIFYGRDRGTGCQCWMCGDTIGRRRRTRHERRQARQEFQALLHEAHHEVD
ncbi:MAG TPA: hypothetical protein VGE77_01765 [Nocardioides sp.]